MCARWKHSRYWAPIQPHCINLYLEILRTSHVHRVRVRAICGLLFSLLEPVITSFKFPCTNTHVQNWWIWPPLQRMQQPVLENRVKNFLIEHHSRYIYIDVRYHVDAALKFRQLLNVYILNTHDLDSAYSGSSLDNHLGWERYSSFKYLTE